MSQRHYIAVRQGSEPVYYRQIFSKNVFADEEFYENLNLDIDWRRGELRETEIPLDKFLLEWWKYISRELDTDEMYDNLDKLLNLEYDDKSLLRRLTNQNRNMLVQYFLTVNELQNYTDPYDSTKIRESCKLYISVY